MSFSIIPSRTQYKNWSLPTKWAFLSAIIGITTGIIGLPIFNWHQKDIRSGELFKAAQELRYNHEYLSALVQKNSFNEYVPYGAIRADALIHVMDQHFELITQSSYGEQKHLYQLSLMLKDAGARFEKVGSYSELRRMTNNSTMSLEDLLFLNDFMLWYLAPILDEELLDNQKIAFGPFDFPNNTSTFKNIDIRKLRYFREDGKPITDFTEYLGLID